MKKLEKIINIIGVPSDFGANTNGALMGPDAIRTAGLNQRLKEISVIAQDWGNIPIPIKYAVQDKYSNVSYLPIIRQINHELKKLVIFALEKGNLPLCLGGDHSISIGSMAGIVEYHKDKDLGLIWIDTHADLNTPESSKTKNIHGMPVSVLFGKGHPELTELMNQQSTIKEENVAIIGLRDLDDMEKEFLKESQMRYYTMRDIDERGIQTIMKEVQKEIIDKVDGIHVSFDLDVMDPLQVPGVSTPVPGGLNLREAHLLLEMIHESNKIISADFVELNPYHDEKGRSARMAVELIASLFGKSII